MPQVIMDPWLIDKVMARKVKGRPRPRRPTLKEARRRAIVRQAMTNLPYRELLMLFLDMKNRSTRRSIARHYDLHRLSSYLLKKARSRIRFFLQREALLSETRLRHLLFKLGLTPQEVLTLQVVYRTSSQIRTAELTGICPRRVRRLYDKARLKAQRYEDPPLLPLKQWFILQSKFWSALTEYRVSRYQSKPLSPQRLKVILSVRLPGKALTLIPWKGESLSLHGWAGRLNIPYPTLVSRLKSGITNPEQLFVTPREWGKLLTLGDRTLRINEWAKLLGVSRRTLSNRLKKGWPIEKVLKEAHLGSRLI